MKDSVRKEVQCLLETLPKSKAVKRLQQEFEDKGFLSKRELKELFGLKERISKAA
jgi:hypothetical protein